MKNTSVRENNIDLMKTVLVVGMILSHTFDILLRNNYLAFITIKYVNLITFSGFLFIYGYNVYNAYIKKDHHVKIKNILILIISFWLCSMTYNYLLINARDINVYLKILTFQELSGYTEFLVTFILIDIFILCFKNIIKKISSNDKYLFLAIIISILFTIMPPVSTKIPYINLFVKTKDIAFPLLPYMNLFFLGIYFAKHKPKFNWGTATVLAVFFALHYVLDNYGYSSRMPLSITYLLASYLIVYLYYFLTIYIYGRKRLYGLLDHLNILGKNSLMSLVISNILLFITVSHYGFVNIPIALLIFLIITSFCYLVFKMKAKILKKGVV